MAQSNLNKGAKLGSIFLGATVIFCVGVYVGDSSSNKVEQVERQASVTEPEKRGIVFSAQVNGSGVAVGVGTVVAREHATALNGTSPLTPGFFKPVLKPGGFGLGRMGGGMGFGRR